MALITTNINLAITSLQNDDVIGLPTETVYGLAGNAFSEKAVNKIFDIKRRPHFNPLIVHIKDITYLEEIVQNIPENAYKLANAFWPGPLTLLLQKKNIVPDIVTANKPTVAVRIPNHPIALELLNKLDFPLAAPSANPFTTISSTTAQHVFNYFEKDINIILDGGECSKGIESTIVGFKDDKVIIYRLGSITEDDLCTVVDNVHIYIGQDDKPIAPGMLLKHYSPKTKTVLLHNVDEQLELYANKKVGILLFSKKIENNGIATQQILSASQNLEEAAKNLYAAMHTLDNANLDIILVELLPNQGIGKAINDRLKRAAN
ncbi:MAG: threonylcarbamoyl-AMP synthase [Ferruginibacter sp.]|nr:threonylcarbamoyl-AMP synthase [Ferruginibacter sp.]